MLAVVGAQRYEELFAKEKEHRHWNDPIENLAEIVFNALQHISNSFKGVEDCFWHLAIDVYQKAYNPFGEEPDGLTPFQQRLTIKLIDKLQDNMKGYYPSICRVLLSTVGPYEQKALQRNNTASNILRNAMYYELKSLPELPYDKIVKHLPDNVSYNEKDKTLTHTYSGGSQAITDLTQLHLEPVNLYDPQLRRSLSDAERKESERDI